jgi:hypothetical protein
MSRVIVMVEGQTESAVVDRIIAPHLEAHAVYIHPRLIGKPGHKGGTRRKFATVLRELRALLKQEPRSTITTFLDYYGLPGDWPGVADSKSKLSSDIPKTVEAEIAKAVVAEFTDSFDPARFIPYIQMYELEALLFSGPEEMAEVFEQSRLRPEFEKIVRECGGCEQIDDDPNTAPSRRIENLYSAYKKGKSELAHAWRIMKRIGLDRVRRACPHFNDWLTRLEDLSQAV